MRLGKERVTERHFTARARMHGEYAVICGYALRERDEFLPLGVYPRLVHEPERSAERAALHRLVHQPHLLGDLRLGERGGIVARNAYPRRPVPHKRRHVDKKFPLRALNELRERPRANGMEKPAAHLVFILAVRRHSEGRKAAVARHLGGDALPQEGLVILFGVLVVVEEIVVRVRVDEPGRDGEPRAIHGDVGIDFKLRAHRNYPLPLDEHIALEALRARAVDDKTVFEKRPHPYPPYARAGAMNL